MTGGLFVNGVATCNGPSGLVAGCLDFAGYPVSYVPTSTFNLGAIYSIQAAPKFTLQPTAAVQFVGSQHLFDNWAEQARACTSPAPSKSVTMPNYTTLNLGLKVPYKHWNVSVSALNVLNKEYNIFEYISAGSYFNTNSTAPANQPQYAYDYVTAYPGAPVTAYVSVSAHF